VAEARNAEKLVGFHCGSLFVYLKVLIETEGTEYVRIEVGMTKKGTPRTRGKGGKTSRLKRKNTLIHLWARQKICKLAEGEENEQGASGGGATGS